MKVGLKKRTCYKKYILALGALLAIASLSGTYAFFNQEMSVSNLFLTGKYDTEIYEEFEPPNDWQPGVEIPKRVEIQNKGNVAVVAVAKITEACERKEDIVVTEYKTENGGLTMAERVVSRKGDILPVRFQDKDGAWQDVAFKDYGTAVIDYDPNFSPEDYHGKWVHLQVADVHYFLYAGVLGGGAASPPLLSAVRLNPLLESAVKKTKLVADIGEGGENRYTFTSEFNEYGYDSIRYKLTIKAKTVQATQEAVDTLLWGGDESLLPTEMIPAEFEDIFNYVRDLCTNSKNK